jgi:hypothetical protein
VNPRGCRPRDDEGAVLVLVHHRLARREVQLDRRMREVKPERRGTSQRAAKLGGVTTVSDAISSRERTRSTAACSASSPSRTLGNIACASVVSSSARVSRRNSCTPRYSSRSFTWWLTAPGVTCSSFAAILKLEWRAAASNARSAFSGGKRPLPLAMTQLSSVVA